jgi:hypothetical protein
VLRRGGRLGIVDGTVPEDDELDRFINDLDVLHDPTTVRNYRAERMASDGRKARACVWTRRRTLRELARGARWPTGSRAPEASSEVFEAARRRLLGASSRVRDHLLVEEKGATCFFDYTGCCHGPPQSTEAPHHGKIAFPSSSSIDDRLARAGLGALDQLILAPGSFGVEHHRLVLAVEGEDAGQQFHAFRVAAALRNAGCAPA